MFSAKPAASNSASHLLQSFKPSSSARLQNDFTTIPNHQPSSDFTFHSSQSVQSLTTTKA